jgi:hypothetical protein
MNSGRKYHVTLWIKKSSRLNLQKENTATDSKKKIQQQTVVATALAP